MAGLPLPQRLLGCQVFWWLAKLGVLSATVESRIGKRLSTRDTLIGSSPRKAKRLGIAFKPRAVAASGRTVRFADGTESDADAIIWATGYQPDYSWIKVPVVDPGGRIRHSRGVTDRRCSKCRQPGHYAPLCATVAAWRRENRG